MKASSGARHRSRVNRLAGNPYTFLVQYSDWANDRVAAQLQRLTHEQLHRDLGASHKSLRDTFAHIVGAERAWLERWKGTPLTSRPPWFATAEVDELAERLREVAAERKPRVAALTDAEEMMTARLLDGSESRMTIGEMLIHVVNHSTLHRGQITSMIRQVGGAPEPTDVLVFVRSRS